MKRHVSLFAAFILLSMAVNAQKGSYYVGGAVGFSSTQTKYDNGITTGNGDKITTWNFSPEVGTFLTNHVQLGIGVTLLGSKTDNRATPTSVITKQNSYGGTLYGRYFFGEGAFKPFVGVNVLALPGKYTYSTSTVETKTFDFGANLNAGFGYALSKKVTAVGSFGTLGYSRSTYKTGSAKSTTSSFGLNTSTLGNRFTVGVYYTL